MPLKYFLIFLAVVLVPASLYQFSHSRRHRRFRRDLAARGNAREIWQMRFPDAVPHVDKVLAFFTDAFLAIFVANLLSPSFRSCGVSGKKRRMRRKSGD